MDDLLNLKQRLHAVEHQVHSWNPDYLHMSPDQADAERRRLLQEARSLRRLIARRTP